MLMGGTVNVLSTVDGDGGGAMASQLMHMTSDQAVQVGALAGYIVLCSWTRNFFPSRCINGYWQI